MSQQQGQPEFGIVYFGNEWFAENRTSSHHLARQLSKVTTVLYVDSPGMRPPNLSSGRDLRRIWAKVHQFIKKPVRLSATLWHCSVPQLPWRWIPGITWLNRMLGGWALRRSIRLAGIERIVLWFVVPHPAFMMDVIKGDLAIYYCIDDYAAHPGVNVQYITECDRLLTERADHVFVAPPALVEAKKALNAATSFSPHGVDADLFAQAQAPATVVPPQAAALAKPVIGYFGLIAAWTDIELIAWLAQSRPQWNFLLIGHASVDVSALASLPNVTMVGPQPYESLPGWAKAFDVAIIPYRMVQQVKNANPLKLREYLATGKPIVSVPTPEVERFGTLVRVAEQREDFLAEVEKALQEGNGRSAERIASVQSMSWEHRAATAYETALQALAAKQARQ